MTVAVDHTGFYHGKSTEFWNPSGDPLTGGQH